MIGPDAAIREGWRRATQERVQKEAVRLTEFYGGLPSNYYPNSKENLDEWTDELMGAFGINAAMVTPAYASALWSEYSDAMMATWLVVTKETLGGFSAWLIAKYVPHAERPYNEDNQR